MAVKKDSSDRVIASTRSSFSRAKGRNPSVWCSNPSYGLEMMNFLEWTLLRAQDSYIMFDQLSKPLLGGPASKNAIQMVWGALLCKIGVDTGILIDVQSSRISYA